MDDARGLFVEGMGAASATSGVLSQLQGKIFALLYLEPRPLSLDQIAAELGQSKSNVSVNIRGLVDWHLVRRVSVPGSRKDHYEAAADFWRVMQEIMERRFRWNLRQVAAAVEETKRAAARGKPASKAAERERDFLVRRLDALGAFAEAVDAGIRAFCQGQAITPESVRRAAVQVVPIRGER